MNYSVKVLPSAIEDLQEIYNYIAYELKSVINAENQLKQMEDDARKWREEQEKLPKTTIPANAFNF